MKKRSILMILLIALPLLVVFIASGPDGVTVFDGENTAYYSWMQPVSNSSVGWCAPVAALLNYAVFAVTVFFVLKKKTGCLKVIRNMAAVAGCLAVVPNLFPGDVMILPNVFGGIALFADAVTAELLRKTEGEEQKNVAQGKRLERR